MIDFRSDTVTQPTEAMRQAIMTAKVGDDVYQDDPTINALEALAAKMTGKESALFVTSGTMGNQLAILTHTRRGDELILGGQSHIKHYEVGASAVLSQVSFHLIDESRGMMPLDSIKAAIRGDDIHYPNTGLICLENAHGSGVVLPLSYMKDVHLLASSQDIPIHLDGARLFNAARALKCDASEITKYVSSVTFCLSKGLGAPVGSLLCGSKSFIERARKYRKMLGGGMRQVGILGAAGLVALQTMVERLDEDHTHAKYLADKLNTLPTFQVDMDRLDINMVFVKSDIDFHQLHDYLETKNIKIGGYKGDYLRIAIHNDISKDHIDLLLAAIQSFLKEGEHL